MNKGVNTFTEEEKGEVKVSVEIEINDALLELIRKDIESRYSGVNKSD